MGVIRMLRLRSPSRRIALLAGGVVLVVALLACQGKDARDEASLAPSEGIPGSPTGVTAAAASPPSQDRVVIGVAGSPPVQRGQSLGAMVEGMDTVVVGTVEGVKEVRHPDARWPFSEPSPNPPLKDPAETIFAVRVHQLITSQRVKAGDIIGVYQTGERTDDGRVYEMEGDPLLDIGTAYLFFLHDLLPSFGLDEFSGPAFGRFVVDVKGMVQPNGWEALPGVAAVSRVPYAEVRLAPDGADRGKALAGLARRTVGEAAATIQAVIAGGPEPPSLPLSLPSPTAIPGLAPRPTVAPPPLTPSPWPGITPRAPADTSAQ
jgi:hypothetical protein